MTNLAEKAFNHVVWCGGLSHMTYLPQLATLFVTIQHTKKDGLLECTVFAYSGDYQRETFANTNLA